MLETFRKFIQTFLKTVFNDHQILNVNLQLQQHIPTLIFLHTTSKLMWKFYLKVQYNAYILYVLFLYTRLDHL